MRLDKYLSSSGLLSRSEAKQAIRKGRVTVNGSTANSGADTVDPACDRIECDGSPISYSEFCYIMLNKPAGYVSATEDGRDPTVLTLLPPELQKRNLFPCGRLDKNTLGLMLLTDNGPLGHRLLSPKHHVAKTYAFEVKFPLSDDDLRTLISGVEIEAKEATYFTKKAEVILSDDSRKCGRITLTEGKYHQIKLMMKAVHNQIVSLERVTFGPLTLDKALARGEWRFLTEEEVALLTAPEEGPQA